MCATYDPEAENSGCPEAWAPIERSCDVYGLPADEEPICCAPLAATG